MAQKAKTTIADGTMIAYVTQIKRRTKCDLPASTDNTRALISFSIIPDDYLKFKSENTQLKAENAALKEKVAAMQATLAEESFDIRETPRDQAKEEIKAFFEDHHGAKIYPSDLMDALHLDYDLIWELCNELEKEGKIKGL